MALAVGINGKFAHRSHHVAGKGCCGCAVLGCCGKSRARNGFVALYLHKDNVLLVPIERSQAVVFLGHSHAGGVLVVYGCGECNGLRTCLALFLSSKVVGSAGGGEGCCSQCRESKVFIVHCLVPFLSFYSQSSSKPFSFPSSIEPFCSPLPASKLPCISSSTTSVAGVL